MESEQSNKSALASESYYMLRGDRLAELMYLAAGAATRPLLEDHPDYTFPSERVAQAVEELISFDREAIDSHKLAPADLDENPLSLAETIQRMVPFAQDYELERELSSVVTLLFLLAGARERAREAGEFHNELRSGDGAHAEDEALGLIRGREGEGHEPLAMFSPEAAGNMLDFINGDAGGEAIEALLPALRKVAGRD